MDADAFRAWSRRAADWGADLAASAKPRSYIVPAPTFVELFDAALPQIISGA